MYNLDKLQWINKFANYSIGSKLSDGTHIYNIEGFWSNLKNSMRNENSVVKCNIDDWLEKYTF